MVWLAVGRSLCRYIGATVWFSVQQLRFTFHLGSLDEQLNQLGQQDSAYTRMFGLILPFGLLANVVVGWLSDRHGVIVSLLATTAVGLAADVLRTVLPLQAQPVGFAAFAAFRAFLFATTVSYLSHTFGYVAQAAVVVVWAQCPAALITLDCASPCVLRLLSGSRRWGPQSASRGWWRE